MKTLMLICILGVGAFAMNAQTRSIVNMDNLPKSINENISDQHEGWSPLEAYKVDNNGAVKYEVLVKKAESEMKLVYDENGKLLESVPHKENAGITGKDKSENCDDQGHKSGTASASIYGTSPGTFPAAQDTTKTPTDTTKKEPTQSGASESGASDYDNASGNAGSDSKSESKTN